MASGTMFTPKTHRQFNASTRTPPKSGPMTNAVPVQAVQVPMARAWAAPEKWALIIASELGTRNAAPTPCKQRAATSTQPLGANAHSSDDTAKTTRPIAQHRQPAESIGDRARNQDERTECEQVSVDHPLLQRQAAAEFPADGRQREVDHRAVQERHEGGQYRDRDERPVGTAPGQLDSCTASSVSGVAAVSAAACACRARWAARMAR